MAQPCNKARVRKWVKALESGEYTQTKRVLHDLYGGFCCLGVACDLYIKSAIGKKVGAHWDKENKFQIGDSKMNYVNLPVEVAEYYGLEERNPYLGEDKVAEKNQNYAIWLNDNCGTSFKDIAGKARTTYGI